MRRHDRNPILARTDIPDISPLVTDVTSVFNPGAVAWNGGCLLLLRVQTRGRETVLMTAESRDGAEFAVRPSLVRIDGLELPGTRIYHVYDPRLTRIGREVYAVLSVDTDQGCLLAVARMRDLERFEIVGIETNRDSRNGVLFPEKVGGRYLRLERPNRTRLASGVTTGEEIWLAESADLSGWSPVGPVMSGRPHYWDEWIGSGPPPVKTREGWLHLYHGVATHLVGAHVYQAGVCLLDLMDPTRVVARGRNNVLEPREIYETVGQVANVVFPTGMIVDEIDQEGFARPDSPVRVYYGAADTCIGLAETTVAELLSACRLT